MATIFLLRDTRESNVFIASILAIFDDSLSQLYFQPKFNQLLPPYTVSTGAWVTGCNSNSSCCCFLKLVKGWGNCSI